jgi:hypothetical protein
MPLKRPYTKLSTTPLNPPYDGPRPCRVHGRGRDGDLFIIVFIIIPSFFFLLFLRRLLPSVLRRCNAPPRPRLPPLLPSSPWCRNVVIYLVPYFFFLRCWFFVFEDATTEGGGGGGSDIIVIVIIGGVEQRGRRSDPQPSPSGGELPCPPALRGRRRKPARRM